MLRPLSRGHGTPRPAAPLKRWQAATALAIGFAVAGAPMPAVPLSAGDSATTAKVDDLGGPAEPLVVEAVLRVAHRPALPAVVGTN